MTDAQRTRLEELGYTPSQIKEITPKVLDSILAARAGKLNASIAKFAHLLDTKVSEQVEMTWDEYLAHLGSEPRDVFIGTRAHSGWSPVVYDPPKRLKDNIKSVSALVLDYDKDADWDRIVAHWHSSFGLIYTTKSHGEADKGNRYRVVLPLERSVTVEEYEQLWAWAERTTPCPIDGQAKDASRFWYDPTPPAGGWRSEMLRGAPLAPDPIIALVVEQPKLRLMRPTQPPTGDQKVTRARAYLAKMPGAVAGQSGHTATFNAAAAVLIGFDLSEQDALALLEADYNPRCSPPWSERELQHKIASVAAQCKRERGYLLVDRPRIDSTRTAAAHAPAARADLNVDWMSLLLVKKDRTVKRGYNNTLVFVRHHPLYIGKWSLDTMTDTPWFDGAPIDPSMVNNIRAHADQRLGYTPSVDDVEGAIRTAAEDRKFHPIMQYLRSLDWDGTPRLSTMAEAYLGSAADHHAQMVRKFMIGAVARVLQPGCKLDTALMLQGAQGIQKSTFFSVLGGAWHADSFVDIKSKDGLMQIHSAWIYELAELENVVMGRSESALKAWMTSSHDMYRAPYQRQTVRRPRSCAICGTTNRDRILTDDTGSRRFWIIPVRSRIPVDRLRADRDQLWAEALAAVEAGEAWWLDEAVTEISERANEDFAEVDSWLEPIADFLNRPVNATVTMTDILQQGLKLDIGKHDRAMQVRAGRVIKALGWTRRQKRVNGIPQWYYQRQEMCHE